MEFISTFVNTRQNHEGRQSLTIKAKNYGPNLMHLSKCISDSSNKE